MNRKRVVLLARPGTARDRTQAAIAEAGADVAALLDPGAATAHDVRGHSPDVVLVILDPAVESLLDKFDDVLGDPAFEVMFEDADVAAKREGWEAARWSRHLNAKLYGHDQVLPRGKGEPAMSDDGVRDTDQDRAFRGDMDALQEQVAALPDLPKPDAARAPRLGAVVVAAGIGGPDAVRQLLGGLPAGFPRPIVLRQRLEGGQYDKLVRQMQRVSELQVVLAQAGEPLQPGTVHVATDDLVVKAGGTGLVFAPAAGAEGDFDALAATDSGLLLLSGADPALVDVAMSVGWAGGLALGQSQDNCFDPAASNALVARGGQAVTLPKLSHQLLQRWPA